MTKNVTKNRDIHCTHKVFLYHRIWKCGLISVSLFVPGVTTEIQMGVSTEGFKLEGEFLGSEPTSCGYMLKLGTVVSKDGMRAVTKWNPNESK